MKIPDDAALDALIAACLALHQAVVENGSPEVQAAYRIMMLELGRQVAQRMPRPNGHA